LLQGKSCKWLSAIQRYTIRGIVKCGAFQSGAK